MKISLGSWAFTFGPFADHPIPFDAAVERLSAAGYDGIEICGFPPHVTLENYTTRESRRELVRFLQEHKLEVSGYAADFSSVNPVDADNRARYLDLFARNVEMCADIGSPSIRVDSVSAPGSLSDKEYARSFTQLADVWRDAAEIALQSGVGVVWEFEPGFVFNKPSEVLKMHREVAHPNFRILFDTCHAYMCAVAGARQHGPRDVLPGGVSEFLDKLQGRIGAVHLIDSDGSLHGDETSTHAPFGKGYVDFEALAPKLLALPGVAWWCIDMGFRADSWELVESSRAFVTKLLEHGRTRRVS